MSKLSIYVIAYNDEPNMRACLESVAGWGDELIVVDSHSTDRTAAISREFTDKVCQVDFHGFGRLRNKAVALTTHEWVFSLDSDERMTPELREEIRQVFDLRGKAWRSMVLALVGPSVTQSLVSLR
jgi:glycosyltransferase involved in cell wall biosynthesis